jgi:WD40 repeat protein
MGPDEALARATLARGFITPDQMKEASAEQARSGLPLDVVLLTKGFIKPDQLREIHAGLNPQAEQTLDVGSAGTPAGENTLPEEVLVASADRRNDLGKYILLQRLGRGGMGEVWKAWEKGLRRLVAIKFLFGGSEEDRRRMLREARVAARLEHSDIVPLYETGESERGPYLAMKLVDGETLDKATLTLRQKLQAVRSAALAINYAHGQGIIHRDIKPQNILVEKGSGVSSTRRPGTTRAKTDEPVKIYVMDFGLAKQQSVDTSLSTSGVAAGTPQYMPPEQARGRSAEIDARSDVWSLGATLYQQVTGVPPFRGDDPLTVLDKVVREDPLPPGRLQPGLPKDVQTIILKCLEKDPSRRYANAEALAEDLRRYLEWEPILARPASVPAKALKWMKRHPAASAMGAVIAASMVVLGVGTAFYVVNVTREREAAQRAAERARAAETEARRQTGIAEGERREAQLKLAESLVSQGDALGLAARWMESRARYDAAQKLYERLGLPSDQVDLGRWEADRKSPRSIQTLAGHQWPVTCLAFSSGGRLAVSGGWDGGLRLWDAATGREVTSWTMHGGDVRAVAFSPDGRQVISGNWSNTIRVCDVETGKVVQTMSRFVLRRERAMVFSPDGRLALVGGDDRVLKLWDVAAGNPLKVMKGYKMPITSVALSPDGRRALSGSLGGEFKLWDVETGRELRTLRGHSDGVESVAFSPDGRTALSGGGDMLLRFWDLETGQEIRSLMGHNSRVKAVAFSPDGRMALSGSIDRTLKLWDVAAGREIWTLSGHTGEVDCVAFSPDGRMALSGSSDREIRLWRTSEGREARILRGHEDQVRGVAFSPDGRLILSGGLDKALKLWDTATGRVLWTARGHADSVECIALSPDGRLALSGSGDRTLKLWDVAIGREVRTLSGHGEMLQTVAFSPDGHLALSGGLDKALKLWDVAAGREVWSRDDHGKIRSVAFSPDGRLALTGDRSTTLTLLEVATGKVVRTLSGHKSNVNSVSFSPDGRWALSAGDDSMLKLWDVQSGREVRNLGEQAGALLGAAFSPDGHLALSGGFDRKLTLWNVETGQEVRTLGGHADRVQCVAFSRDGRAVLSGSTDKTVRIWDFGHSIRGRALEARMAGARAVLQSDPGHAESLAVMGEWYAFLGFWDWGIDFLEKAREGGARVSALDLGRCYWEKEEYSSAKREFERALAQGEAPADYLKLCLTQL